MADPISTEARIFVRQLTRDIQARERLGAGLLAPGCTTWEQAFKTFMYSMRGIGSVRKGTALFKAAIIRLGEAQKERACFVNSYLRRSRSAIFEVVTYEVAKHPLVPDNKEGVLVRVYYCRLQRNGRLSTGARKLAFMSWHALARMAARSSVDIFEAGSVAAFCGFAGLIMSESEKHLNTSLAYATQDMTVVGVLRHAVLETSAYSFFDVLTALPWPLDPAPSRKQIDGSWAPGPTSPFLLRQRAQGIEIARAVHSYLEADDSNPTGLADNITVIPFDASDYISIKLKQKEEPTDGKQEVPTQAATRDPG